MLIKHISGPSLEVMDNINLERTFELERKNIYEAMCRNYGPTIKISKEAELKGFHQVLWLTASK